MINVGIVGYGYAGRVLHAPLIKRAEGLHLYAICTRDPERQQAATQDHPGTRIYAKLDDLLADRQVDLVVIATPHHTHRDLAIQAMGAGKHVVSDKVMCLNAHEAREMIAASRRNRVTLSVFHNRRWDGDYLTVKKAIADGLLGQPYLFQTAIMRYGGPRRWRANLAESGGILYDWPAHLLDQALQLVPAPVERVYCQVIERGRWQSDIGNYARMTLHFANGVLYDIEVGNLAALDKPRWYIAGDLGALTKFGLDPQENALRAGDLDAAVEDPANRAQLCTWAGGEAEKRVLETIRGSWVSYYRNIADVLSRGAELAVRPEEVLRAMRVYDAAMRSVESGQVIQVERKETA